MISSIYWAQRLKEQLEAPNPNKLAEMMEQVSKFAQAIETENQAGVEMCKTFLIQSQIRDGLYTCVTVPMRLDEEVQRFTVRPNVKVTIDLEGFPPWVLADSVLLKIIMDNSVDNACSHGQEGGAVEITLRVVNSNKSQIVLSITNKPGPKHRENMALQEERGKNSLILQCDTNLQYNDQIGSTESAFLGLAEVTGAAKAMDANVNLDFTQHSVVFTLMMGLVIATEPHNSGHVLPEDTVFVCADDDKVPRLKYKALLKQPALNADSENSVILGANFDEVSELARTVMRIAAEVGETKMICIFDQNMDQYEEGTILGTTVTSELRSSGFKAPIFICSANDDFYALEAYRKAGASGAFNKSVSKPSVLAAKIVGQYHEIARMSGV